MEDILFSKERFCKECHVSKATALWLIQSGLVPAIDTQRKTDRYLISAADVKEYLQQRELDPKKYRYRGYPSDFCNTTQLSRKAHAILKALWANVPDMLCLRDVELLLGYERRVLVRWRKELGLQTLKVGRTIYYPKQYLEEFILGPTAGLQYPKSPQHIELLNKIHTHSDV